MKVFVLIKEYDFGPEDGGTDHAVIGVFSSKELAEKAKEKKGEGDEIEEFEIDNF